MAEYLRQLRGGWRYRNCEVRTVDLYPDFDGGFDACLTCPGKANQQWVELARSKRAARRHLRAQAAQFCAGCEFATMSLGKYYAEQILSANEAGATGNVTPLFGRGQHPQLEQTPEGGLEADALSGQPPEPPQDQPPEAGPAGPAGQPEA